MTEAKGYDYVMEECTGKILAVQRTTGAVLDTVATIVPVGSITYTPEQQEEYKRRKELERQLEEAKMLRGLQRGCNDPLGYFYFVKKQAPLSNISPESLTRLVYLNTYMNYENKLMFSERTPIKSADLPALLGVSSSTVSRFLKEVCPIYLAEQEDGLMFANNDIFKRGRLSQRTEAHQKFYIEGIRRLYTTSARRNDRQLGYLFKLLPYINIEYNLICRNPLETDINKIELISVADFCEMVGYDVAHVNKLLKIYNSILFDVDGHLERFCAIAYDGIHKAGAKIIINPHILYSGSDYSKVEVLGVFCTD